MFSLKKLREEYRDAWCIWRPLAADTTIVIPRSAGRTQANISGNQRTIDSQRVVILGFAYDYVAGNGFGFDLVSKDYASPVGTPQQYPTNRIIWSSRATTAQTQVALCVPECFIPLHPGVYTSPVLKDPADLTIDITSTPPTSGNILIWGALMDQNHPLLLNNNFGSPFSAGAVPPN